MKYNKTIIKTKNKGIIIKFFNLCLNLKSKNIAIIDERTNNNLDPNRIVLNKVKVM